MSRLLQAIKIILLASLFASLLSGCGGPSVSETYPLESVTKDGGQSSYIYRAANKSVPEVAKELTDQKKPDQVSKEDTERMFLVYPNELYHLQKDPKQPQDTLIEVDNKQYVQQNYNPSFLEGYLLASLLTNMFDFDFGRSGKYYGDYRGYTDKDKHKPKTSYRSPTEQDKKTAPPMTVERKGSIFKRGKSSSGSNSDSGGLFDKPSSSKGKISKGGGDSKGSDSWFSPPKTKKPKTSKGVGKIFKRRR